MCVICNFVSQKPCEFATRPDVKFHLSKSPKFQKKNRLVKIMNICWKKMYQK